MPPKAIPPPQAPPSLTELVGTPPQPPLDVDAYCRAVSPSWFVSPTLFVIMALLCPVAFPTSFPDNLTVRGVLLYLAVGYLQQQTECQAEGGIRISTPASIITLVSTVPRPCQTHRTISTEALWRNISLSFFHNHDCSLVHTKIARRLWCTPPPCADAVARFCKTPCQGQGQGQGQGRQEYGQGQGQCSANYGKRHLLPLRLDVHVQWQAPPHASDNATRPSLRHACLLMGSFFPLLADDVPPLELEGSKGSSAQLVCMIVFGFGRGGATSRRLANKSGLGPQPVNPRSSGCRIGTCPLRGTLQNRMWELSGVSPSPPKAKRNTNFIFGFCLPEWSQGRDGEALRCF
jgi:hypothetical protein